MKKIKSTITVFVLLAVSLVSLASYAQQDIKGKWSFGEKNNVIEIEQHNGIYSGKIISSDNPNTQIGKLIVKEVQLIEGKWQGKVYAPKREEWYDAEYTPKDNLLEVKIKVGFFSKTIEWIRIKT
ncbi:DUF2147 domain-containing protein [Formosa sediminum]|uniref:DUF2147 domain-containing protein n=1 Tax=Formosa sediminum TaxID=2594004 RepID=A0A516GUS9_9FLAO|nr:DUF2147 domain-containing protein [Formosa sediminum]QDO95245.1 DUF2147 domain-containing protein [Formosa sediminum]